jgi:hypothetical protein
MPAFSLRQRRGPSSDRSYPNESSAHSHTTTMSVEVKLGRVDRVYRAGVSAVAVSSLPRCTEELTTMLNRNAARASSWSKRRRGSPIVGSQVRAMLHECCASPP